MANGSRDIVLHSFYQLLTRERLARNLSVEALAREAGVSPGTIRRLETGRGKIRNLRKVAKALNFSLKQLLA